MDIGRMYLNDFGFLFHEASWALLKFSKACSMGIFIAIPIGIKET